MDDEGEKSETPPPAAQPLPLAVEEEEPLRDIVENLRSEVENQAKTIDFLNKTMATYEAERIQIHTCIALLQAELQRLASSLAAQQLEERFEALRCDVTTELYYLHSALAHSSHSAPCSSIQRDAAIHHISQELYHRGNVLWEQVAELRKEIHHIHGQLGNQRHEIQCKLSEKLNTDMYLQRTTGSCQAQERSFRQQQPQDVNTLSLDISDIQSKLEAVRLSKGEACEKTGGNKFNSAH
ncbi:transcription elongation factor 1 homolog isoform X1 [Centroberyx affinis]|uniref:transcription elongation factor 1 homolog isoform X1 n=1 Tax=Centroberyx affinis TaxID=166261 RepID=UPI003A5C382D